MNANAGSREEQMIELHFSGLGFTVISGFYFLIVGVAATTYLQYLLVELGLEIPPSWEIGKNVIVVLVCFVVPALAIWLRQPRGARITWDEWGVTEWDGRGVRTAIAWQGARLFVKRTTQRMYSSKYTAAPMLLVQITDGDGRRIMVGNNPRSGRLCRRRGEVSSRQALEELVSAAESHELGAAEPASGNELSPGRPGRRGPLSWGAAAVGYTLFVYSTAPLTASTPQLDQAVPLLLAATLALFLRLVRPARELVAVAMRSRALAGARWVEIVGNIGTQLLVKERGSGEELEVETEGFVHPDGRILERRGPALLRLRPGEATGGKAGDPYRSGGAPRRPAILETDGVVEARRTLQRAIVLELLLRGSLPTLTLVTALTAYAEMMK